MLESVVTYILAYAFVFAAFYLLGVRGRPRTVRWLLAWGVVLLFVALLVGSAWRDTVNPLIRWGAWEEAVWAVAGFLVVLAGLGAVLYGGFRFMQETSWAFGDEAMQRNLAVIRERKKHLPVSARGALGEPANPLACLASGNGLAAGWPGRNRPGGPDLRRGRGLPGPDRCHPGAAGRRRAPALDSQKRRNTDYVKRDGTEGKARSTLRY